jgi:hypothetical protein
MIQRGALSDDDASPGWIDGYNTNLGLLVIESGNLFIRSVTMAAERARLAILSDEGDVAPTPRRRAAAAVRGITADDAAPPRGDSCQAPRKLTPSRH